MKKTCIVILLILAVLGIVYAGSESQKKNKGVWKYKPLDLCKFPVTMEVGHFIQLKECHKRKIELKQVKCEEIGKGSGDFPCYKGCETIQVKANFPAIFNASIDTSADDKDMIKEVNLYWENSINTIQGTGQWEELTLCLEAWDVEIWNSGGIIGTVEIGEITIGVKPPDASNHNALDDPNLNPKDAIKNDIKDDK